MTLRKLPDNFLNVTQGTPEWLMARCGCVTASRFKDVVAKLKSGKESAARLSYKMDILTEILTGRVTDNYVSEPMQFGLDNEPLARTQYEIEKDVEVEKVGFVLHPLIARSGASPDGLVGDEGLVEFKVPTTATHLTYLMDGIVPDEYKPQMMWQMACTGRSWCDFVSYDPRLPQEFGLFVIRLQRDEKVIAEMEAEVQKFINEVGEMCQKLQAHKAEVKQPDPTYQGPPRAEIPVRRISVTWGSPPLRPLEFGEKKQ